MILKVVIQSMKSFMINTSIKTTGNHKIYSSSTQEPQRHAPQADAGSASKLIHPALQGLPSIPHGGATPRQALVNSPLAEHARRSEAFKAQRQAIAMQPGPSNHPHLIALDKLEARGFEPAAGGIKIPLTPNSLPGGGKRVQTVGTSSRDVHVVPAGIAPQLREAIQDKQLMIQTLTQELAQAEEEGNPAEIAQNQRLLAQARQDLAGYMRQAAVYGEESRRINR
ncbi:type III effector protein AvrRps4 [Paracidovorax citrulli]|nr:hypothetical protein FRC90_03535 [Paracidovorax citrulli]SDK38019.1 type III effector protein AvrRps4 [Paracidovorax citrulli]